MYVSIEATTTRASTVIRSMPTSETRTQASMTIPLSSTRSRTSMRLVPPVVRSTGIGSSSAFLPLLLFLWSAGAACGRRSAILGEQGHLRLERGELAPQIVALAHRARAAGSEVRVVFPPVEPDLLCLVDRADDEPDANREELDFGQRDLDVTRDGEALVEDT